MKPASIVTFLKRIIAAVFPPLRRRFAWTQTLPLLSFLAFFAAAVLGLEHFDVLQFVRPAAFGLIGITAWFWWTHLTGFNGLTKGRAFCSLWVRLCVFGVFVMLMAEPRSIRTTDEVSVIYAIDISDSIGDRKVDDALTFVNIHVSQKPTEDEAGMVVFGGSAAVELSPSKTWPFEGVVASQIQRGATDIAQALSLGAAILPEDHAGRIVLISDGTATSGDLNKTLDLLRSRNIKVDVLPIDYQYQNEVWIERLEIPQNVKLGQDYDATIIIGSLKSGRGELTFTRNGEEIVKRPIDFDEGKTRVTIPMSVDVTGYFEFEAAIGFSDAVSIAQTDIPRGVNPGESFDVSIVVEAQEPGTGYVILSGESGTVKSEKVAFGAGKTPFKISLTASNADYYKLKAAISARTDTKRDHLKQNNVVRNYMYVEGEGKVLVVTDPLGNENDWSDLVSIIKATDRVVDIMDANEFPNNDTRLMEYDCIVWANVPKDAFNEAQIEALHDSVYELGTGFLMVGGPDSFGPGGYHNSLVEKALPVSMDISQKKMLPKGALVIILHTCEFPDGNTWGKRITKEAIRVLSPQDEVGVISYTYGQNGGGDSWLFKLTPASKQTQLFPKITNAQIGDMPSFVKSMKMGLVELVKSDAAAKQMIIISDGDPTPPPQVTLDAFVKAKIKISTIAVFPHGNKDISSMAAVAKLTGGNYYKPLDPKLLPGIFIKEARTLKRNMVQEKTFIPQLGTNSPIMKGVQAIQPLHGYVLTTLKPKAQPILLTPPENNEEGIPQPPDPVLAKWRYGLGSTAAFTSDISKRWGKDWVSGWDKFKPLMKQLLADISRVRQQGELRLWTYSSGTDGVFIIEDYAEEEAFLEIAAKLRGPNKELKDVSFRQISSRRYQARVPLWGQGRYQLIAKGVGNGRTDTTIGGFIVPYSPEYLRFRANPIVLDEIAEKTGGQILNADSTAESIFGVREPKQSSKPVYDYFMLVIACLIPLDVAIRRFQIDFFALTQMLKRKKKTEPSTSTMGALLQRKQSVDEQLDAQREQPLQPQPTQSPFPIPEGNRLAEVAAKIASKSAGKASNKSGNKDDKKKPTAGGVTGTTSRLLALKRRRQEDDE